MAKSLLRLLECGLDVINNLTLKIFQESLGLGNNLVSDVGDVLNNPGWLGRGRFVSISFSVKNL